MRLLQRQLRLLSKDWMALIHAEENQRQKLEEARSKYQEIQSELQSVQSELETTGKRIDELNAKDNLTFVEQEELDRLKETNDELERQQHLLEAEEKVAKRQQNEEFVKTADKDINGATEYQRPIAGGRSLKKWSASWWLANIGSGGSAGAYISEAEYIEEQFEELEKLKDQLSNASTLKEQKRIQKQINAINDYFVERSKQWQEDSKDIDYIKEPSNEDEEKVNDWLDFINDFRDRMAIAMSSDYAKDDALNRILGKEEFSSVKTQLDELGRSGELTGEKVKELIENADGLYDKLVKLGIVSADDTDWFDGLANSLNKVQDSVDGVTSSGLTSLGDVIKTITEHTSSLSTAYKEMSENGKLSLGTVNSLIEAYPELKDKIIATSDGYTIEKSALEEVIDAQIQKYELELSKAETAALASASACGIEVQGFNEVTDAIYEAVEAKLLWLSTPDNVVGMNFDEWSAQYKQAAATMKAFDEVRQRRNDLGALRNSLNDEVFADTDKSAAKSATDTADKTKDLNKQFDNLAKTEAFDTLKHKLDTLEQPIERITQTISTLKDTLDLTAEDDNVSKIEITSQQLDLARQKAGLLADEFTQLQNTEYNSADAANELASRMKSVADEIADNQKSIIEYGKNITQYYTAALSAIGSLSKSTIDEATNLIDRNIKALSEGGLTGLDFTLTPSVPQSAVEKQRQENKTLEDEMKAHYDAVAKMQKTALDMQYQETMADHARQREELVKSLNEQKNAVQSHASTVKAVQKKTDDDIKQEQKDTNTQTSAEQERDNNKKLVEEKGFLNLFQSNLESFSQWLTQNPIKAPELDKSWEENVTKAESYVKRIKDAVSGVSTSLGSTWSSSLTGNLDNALNGDKRAKAVVMAAKYEGVPYVWGGTSPSGFDCSGLVQYVYSQNGIKNVPRVAADQYRASTKLTKEQLKPGDLIFTDFDSSGNAQHVGIYAGNGKVVAASSSRQQVSIQDFNSYWQGGKFGRFAEGTLKTTFNGEAGENYKDELLLDKKTHEVTHINSPTLIDTNKVDVIGEKDTARILKNQFAKGTITIPDGLGKSHSYTQFDEDGYLGSKLGYWNKSSAAWKLFKKLLDSGELAVDQNGIYTYKGIRLAATTSHIGQAGDLLKINQNGGEP